MAQSQRELNPELFSPEGATREDARLPRFETTRPDPMTESNWVRAFESQMAHLQSRAREWENKIDKMEGKVTEFLNTSQGKFERLAKIIQRLDESSRQVHEDHNRKLAHLNARINERKVQDSKIEELMDRQNQMVKNFEVRLAQLQKLINDKEMLLMKAHTALEDARQEIARLKRF